MDRVCLPKPIPPMLTRVRGVRRVVFAAGTDRMMRRTISYVMHTISYIDLRCRRFDNKRKKYTISYKTYDIVCLQCRPTTSYTISTYDIVYDINLQTYDVVGFREHTTSHTTWISWNVQYRTSDLRCRMLHLRCSQTYDVVCSMSY